MCGRFSLGVGWEDLCRFFDIPLIANLLEPRYTIAPAQGILVVRAQPSGGTREITRLRWGLVPFWAKDTAIGNKLINARSETVAEKPSFREAFRKRRCLVPATGFYEWQRGKGGKQPYHIRMKGGGLFAMAGLWECWAKGAEPLETCTILTTAPNELMAPIHDRMPVILSPADFPAWIGERQAEFDGLRALLKPHSAEAMEAFPAQTTVNNLRNESPECLLPFE